MLKLRVWFANHGDRRLYVGHDALRRRTHEKARRMDWTTAGLRERDQGGCGIDPVTADSMRGAKERSKR
jgi:hypothetical protein